MIPPWAYKAEVSGKWALLMETRKTTTVHNQWISIGKQASVHALEGPVCWLNYLSFVISFAKDSSSCASQIQYLPLWKKCQCTAPNRGVLDVRLPRTMILLWQIYGSLRGVFSNTSLLSVVYCSTTPRLMALYEYIVKYLKNTFRIKSPWKTEPFILFTGGIVCGWCELGGRRSVGLWQLLSWNRILKILK